MEFTTSHLIRYQDLNSHDTLFGGQLLAWVDEEAAAWVMYKTGKKSIVTKLISEVNFQKPARKGDLIEIGIDLIDVGETSYTVCCEVRNKTDHTVICSIDKIVFVHVDPSTHKRSYHHQTFDELKQKIVE